MIEGDAFEGGIVEEGPSWKESRLGSMARALASLGVEGDDARALFRQQMLERGWGEGNGGHIGMALVEGEEISGGDEG